MDSGVPGVSIGREAPAIWDVIAALCPAAAVGVFFFGPPALAVLTASIGGCVLIEGILTRCASRRGWGSTTSAVLTGLLLGMMLPPSLPLPLIFAGCTVAMLAAGVSFGPTGRPFHPALAGQVFMQLAFPAPMTRWSAPGGFFSGAVDAVTSATPLAPFKPEQLPGGRLAAKGLLIFDVLAGRLPGNIGETSVLALGLGGCYLLWRARITWHVPVSFLGSCGALAAVATMVDPGRCAAAGFHLAIGGALLGALFVAADPATSPGTPRGKVVFGAGCGVLAWFLWSYGGHPAGVAFAILIMSAFTPLIDLYARPRPPE